MRLTPLFDDAFRYAPTCIGRSAANSTPYIAHLMAVAALVIEHGGDED